MNDEVDNVQQQMLDVRKTFSVKTDATSLEVPEKSSSPAFSIHATKVYILYPSLFQDPNIFGRFSIPQNINLDPENEASKGSHNQKPDQQPVIVAGNQGNSMQMNTPFGNLYQQGSRRTSRQAPSSVAVKPNEVLKRNVESQMSGTIVVLNQDVNEINQKDAYWSI